MIPSSLVGADTHRDLAHLLQKERELVLSGAGNETAKALLIAHLRSFHVYPSIVVTENEGQAEALRHWLHFFAVPCELLMLPDGMLDSQSLQRALRFLLGETEDVLVTTRAVWEANFPLLKELQDMKLTLEVGSEEPFTQFVERLIELGYEHCPDAHLLPGQYRRTGDVLDVFPVQLLEPVRVSFEFDTVSEIVVGGEKKEEIDILPVAFSEEAPLGRQFPEKALLILDDQDDVEAPKNGKMLRFTSFPESAKHHAHVRYLSILKFYTLTDFLNDLRDKLSQGWRLLIVSRRSDELKAIFDEERIRWGTVEDPREGGVVLVPVESEELLPHSLQNPDLQCALLTDREIFSLKKQGKQRSIQKLALDFITSLSPGDYVVHMEHGIGRFEGMTQKIVDGVAREYLELSYAEGDKLFIPVDQADKLSKFVHEEGNEPILTRLGTNEWKKVTARIREEAAEVAKELLQLYAKRAAARGHAFPPDDAAMAKFDTSFPYVLTPGQKKAIEDIESDMEDQHPMDRLVCGDVGFGKTEVAMRAAFKAAHSGKQVAVIAPITILADQHYKNFIERMKEFSIRIEMLSRFRSAKEQKETIERLRKGDVDIIIGTHRLLQDDVKFMNLGLVIIDEEQRFGVKQKEKMKELRASVDMLTLTATPIPRTLNLGLHKLRDITTITTPPPGRLPIITEVRKYSDRLVKDAILRETKRDGQCFVLHNRVETIDAFADKLRELIPGVTFVVAHGQLSPDDLEERILKFKKGECQVLVSSTIIENGIDLPRANTLIVNEAERFGLSQLYQLRGRVGRGKVQAFAYFLYHSQKLQEDAKKRLRAIVEACELGSGFQVAMRDLEIRGAGEILGVSQAGTMNTVGVSHYLRMLKNAVEELRAGRTETEEEIETVEILLPIEALIPTFYIPESDDKIAVYQKLASCEDESLLKEFEQDLREEYGEPPQQVKNLFAVLRLKLVCRAVGIPRVKAEDQGKGRREVVVTLSSRVSPEEIMQLLSKNPQWRISSNTLRIAEAELQKPAGAGKEYVSHLAKELSLLRKKDK